MTPEWIPNILGLDLSLTSTGWSCKENYGTITTELKGAERLLFFYKAFNELLEEQSWPGVVIESYSYASKGSRQFSIGELGGVIRLALIENKTPFVEVPPTCRAKFATGKGNASKNEVISAVSARTGITWTGKGADDMCDAWVLQEMGLCALGHSRFEWPEIQKSSLLKIDWSLLEIYNA